MDRNTSDIEQIRRGITRAALAHEAQIAKLQAELQDAYEREIGMASVVAERRKFSQELYATRLKLDMYRKKYAATEKLLAERDRQLGDVQSKLTALSNSFLGALQLKYWRRGWRRGGRKG
ncbi:hypothetical protein [Paenarthrobacter sp. NCHU4564]|uniref:hypothetical protein n=1 Tax=Paenarthrobacter sp. NCHU4564 TaxID=3451353 RepID=UPI003F986958